MDRLKLLLLGLILLGCIIVPLATKAAVRDLTDRQVAMLLPPLWLAPALPGAPRSHLGDIEAPYRADGIATVDIDLDTGGYQLILDDGATGAGNGAIYFGQDTDLQCHRSGANTLACEGNLTLTGIMSNPDGDLCFGAACDAAGTTGNVTFGGDLTTFDNASQFDGTMTTTYIEVVQDYGIRTTSVGTIGVEFFPSLSSQTPNTGVLATGTTSEAIVIMQRGDASANFANPKQTHPTLISQSIDATDPDEGMYRTYAGNISRTSAAAEDNHDVVYGTGTQTNAGDFASGDQTYCSTGATTTDGKTGDCIAQTGASGDGTGVDAGDHVWNVNGANEAARIDGETGVLTLAQAPVFADYTRHHDIPIGAAIVGAAAPAVETIGTFRCYVFDANADLAHISVEVPSEWNGSSDMAIDVLIFTDQGDALGSGEVIEFDLVYRSVDEGEAYDNGTAVTILANVTGGGAEVDKGQYKITATVDYDDTDQPLAVNDTLGFSIMRDVTTGDTYSGDVHVCRAQLVYTANALATH